jgi:hypothetical protein
LDSYIALRFSWDLHLDERKAMNLIISDFRFLI